MVKLQQLLKIAVKEQASDIHLVAGSPPVLRIAGDVVRVKADPLGGEEIRQLCYSVISEEQRRKLEEEKQIDFGFEIKNISRFRGNCFYQKGEISAVFRRVAVEIPSVEELGLPESVMNLGDCPNGMVLVTGPTGSGKSTSLAAILSSINSNRRSHIITLEDPIEYIHEHKKSIVNQREIGSDTQSFLSGLRSALRQDPDICLLGELRDQDSIEAALKVAETGHLVFSTLHTNSAVQSINRIVSVFSAEDQDRVRSQLSFVLQAVVSQKLIPSIQGGVVAAFEILKMTTAIRSLIREGKTHQVYGMMQVGQEETLMQTMNQALTQLLVEEKIDLHAAFKHSNDPEELDKILRKAGM